MNSKRLTAVFVCLGFLFFTVRFVVGMSSKQPEQQKTGWHEDEIEKSGIWVPPDLSKAEKKEWKNGRPPGWSRGKKTGWRGGKMPPGLAKKQNLQNPPQWGAWTKDQQNRWGDSLNKIEDIIRNRADKTAWESMVYSVESAARRGVPTQQLETVTNQFMRRKLNATEYEQVTRAMAYGVGKNADFPGLARFVNNRIDRGARGDDLAIQIYKEIANRSAQR